MIRNRATVQVVDDRNSLLRDDADIVAEVPRQVGVGEVLGLGVQPGRRFIISPKPVLIDKQVAVGRLPGDGLNRGAGPPTRGIARSEE